MVFFGIDDGWDDDFAAKQAAVGERKMQARIARLDALLLRVLEDGEAHGAASIELTADIKQALTMTYYDEKV